MGILTSEVVVGDAEPDDNRPVGYYANNDDDWPTQTDENSVDVEDLMALFQEKNTG